MVFSYYLTKLPYQCVWHALKYTRFSPILSAYCGESMDYIILREVCKYLPSMPFLAKNMQVARYLQSQDVKVKRLPVFPQAVMMARHAAFKFPEKRIRKVGFRHGAYHFKKFIKAESYNAFDIYFMSSEDDNREAQKAGIHSGVPIGFPKLDPAFDGTWTAEKLAAFADGKLDPLKKTILFSATWDMSGMSAVDKWYKKINNYSERFNIIVTLHPFTANRFKQPLMQNKRIHYISTPDILPYLLLADVMVGDSSSILVEFCALDKPIITFKVPPAQRTVPRITELIASFSHQIDDSEALESAIDHCLDQPTELQKARQQANELMFYKLDGKAGLRAAQYIQDML